MTLVGSYSCCGTVHWTTEWAETETVKAVVVAVAVGLQQCYLDTNVNWLMVFIFFVVKNTEFTWFKVVFSTLFWSYYKYISLILYYIAFLIHVLSCTNHFDFTSLFLSCLMLTCTVWVKKNPPPPGDLWQFFQNRWEFFN